MKFLVKLLLVIAFFVIAYFIYKNYFNKNIQFSEAEYHLHIPTGADVAQVADILKNDGVLFDKKSFIMRAKKTNYKPRAGRFQLKNGMNNRALVRHLTESKQSPVQLIIHHKRTTEQVAAHLAKTFEADSLAFIETLTDKDFLHEIGYTPNNIMAAIIPNTYQFFWNTSPRDFCKRMIGESKRFWNDDRLRKAAKLDLTPIEVIILASIVESETRNDSEKSRIAGVYLNRLNTPGWKLQSDPTVVYATRTWGIKRLLHKHLEINSPYNTYRYAGLPPGPICMPSILTIDRTLEAETHDYMFFCAKPDKSGHAFAKTYEAHKVNAKRYHRARRMRGE